MSTQRERMWSAYLDGELSASEAADFDQSLTAAEKEQFQAEVRLEGCLGEALSQGAACPEETWKRTRAAVQALNGQPARRVTPWWLGAYGVAAVLALTFAGVVYQAYFATPSFLDCSEPSADSLVASLELKADSLGAVNDYLHSHGIALTLTSTHGKSGGRHSQELLGVCEEDYQGEPVAQLVYECCGKPVKVVIAPKEGQAAAAIRRAIDANRVQEFRTIGDYLAVAVSNHYAHGLLDMLSEEQEIALLRI
ncbi:MAG: hypothetical protein IT364_27560 [Candidatus Hydrogenedentes bacterium]|nr:hypothetical protein [Candidatus Hydrogenedentota bacterium]